MSYVNEYVRYGSNGIFRIEDIRKRTNQDGVIEDWYILSSHKEGVDTSVMTPVSNAAIRPVLTREEIIRLIKEMPCIPSIWSDDKRERCAHFKAILNSNNVYELIQMIRSIYLMRKKKESEGKRLSDQDKGMFMDAENLLFEEISISYDINKEDVADFIMEHVDESHTG